ncbi:putative periplasmic protein [Campylobacter jejuni subsp. jejuni 1336]|nr:putative periplasmic protein [Campylobacter jejuni subsp. jejuni 1336]
MLLVTQANTTDNRNFNIPEYYFNDNKLYDKTNSTYKNPKV